jgi:hypothetical protein
MISAGLKRMKNCTANVLFSWILLKHTKLDQDILKLNCAKMNKIFESIILVYHNFSLKKFYGYVILYEVR